ncbi:Fic family protein [Marinagarivorans cellulosilyticus]|uniref:Fido domain-containing protein n=1 Tax=Marinagarivorans cellulosilyticus TaxID=2721545 RepID=A0AAN1WKN0_9GAMM|nr:Fic family protein [Marinagarivorans cellulosilyticus]BCD99353.1 hypothetical protein MARGE09_P3555 [Marinagarivorans cellulosilyticus]
MQYIWQNSRWQQHDAPAFEWDGSALTPSLERVRLKQGQLLEQSGRLSAENKAAQLDALIQTALRTSEIEGETLNAASVRSSVVRHLGLEQAGIAASKEPMFSGTPQTEALVKLLIEATTNISQPLSLATLCQWQADLFPEIPRYQSIIVGELRGETPMQVVSGRIDKPTIHFEAPPRHVLNGEVERFVNWFNNPPTQLDPLLRAAIAHLWLITLHPFDDGNGRVTRALTDQALAQAESSSIRFYSLSAAIMARRKEYYAQLEQAQKGNMDITTWLQWFLSVLDDAITDGLKRFERVLNKTRFWQAHAQTVLSAREIKVLNRLLDNQGEEFLQGINASKYQALAKVSKATATRELAGLVKKNCLIKLAGGGRSTRYTLAVITPVAIL